MASTKRSWDELERMAASRNASSRVHAVIAARARVQPIIDDGNLQWTDEINRHVKFRDRVVHEEYEPKVDEALEVVHFFREIESSPRDADPRANPGKGEYRHLKRLRNQLYLERYWQGWSIDGKAGVNMRQLSALAKACNLGEERAIQIAIEMGWGKLTPSSSVPTQMQLAKEVGTAFIAPFSEVTPAQALAFVSYLITVRGG